ncbi:MAG: class II fumarate hydratase [Pseudomonadaceae bacterium]|nr:class II fumarate hydratase [Pseudomonadaceae bacterium]
MTSTETRLERDSLGDIEVPIDALYAAQTQRALNNIRIGDALLPAAFTRSIALVKAAAASCNAALGHLDADKARAIEAAAIAVANGQHDEAFVLGPYQTGSGTSTNMNANEVIASLASQASGLAIHPNDDVNYGQSSNDVIPTAIHISAALATAKLQNAVRALIEAINSQADRFTDVVKTGRTHLMDALPMTVSQEMRAWSAQLEDNLLRLESSRPRLHRLAIGGTAIGSGLNADPALGARIAAWLVTETYLPFTHSDNAFRDIACQDTAVELSGQLNVLATSMMKISNDLRWLNSGPVTGLSELTLPVLQPGSSIMPGKVNPVVPEAVAMVCARIMGNHTCVTVAGQSGNFQLNVMLPVVANSLLESLSLLTDSADNLRQRVFNDELHVHTERLSEWAARNPITITAINERIGYETGAKIAKQAYAEGRSVLDVAEEVTGIARAELADLLNPARLTKG